MIDSILLKFPRIDSFVLGRTHVKYNDGSNNLEIISPSQTCLKSGDTVMFIDWDTSFGGYYFLTNWNGGEYIFLWD
ncbi:hypothetical protein LEP1GSC018_2305 [Leptospira kirschneri str. 2008720114]|nr:hypothetical protein LEP1GSC018_2305 [Leptospira kirschneri str. 2008720114]